MPRTPRPRSCFIGVGDPIYLRLGFAMFLPLGLLGEEAGSRRAETGRCRGKEMSGNHDASFVEARAALPLDGGVECRQPEWAEDGLVPFRAGGWKSLAKRAKKGN